MKKISISNLEVARHDPISFITTFVEEGGYGYPKSLRWLDSICEYHRTSNLSHSISFLQAKFAHRNRTLQNIREEEKLTQALLNYVSEHHTLLYKYKKSRLRLDIKLSDKVGLGGLIWLINDTSDGGLASYTITDIDNVLWHNELRYPLIQNYLANTLKYPLESVAVGTLNYTTGKHEQKIYPSEDIKLALEEVRDIGEKISSVL